MNEIACHPCLPNGKLAGRYNVQKQCVTHKHVTPTAAVSPMTTITKTNLSAL